MGGSLSTCFLLRDKEPRKFVELRAASEIIRRNDYVEVGSQRGRLTEYPFVAEWDGDSKETASWDQHTACHRIDEETMEYAAALEFSE